MNFYVRNENFFSLKHGDVCVTNIRRYRQSVPEFIVDKERAAEYYANYDKPYRDIHYLKLRDPWDRYKTLCVPYRFIIPNPERVKYPEGFKIVEYSYSNSNHSFRFRMDPVPGIHKARYSNYLRYPKTTPELRASYACDRKLIRGKRLPSNIPDSWDDQYRSDVRDRSWKRSTKKRKQWM